MELQELGLRWHSSLWRGRRLLVRFFGQVLTRGGDVVVEACARLVLLSHEPMGRSGHMLGYVCSSLLRLHISTAL